ncbi:MAG: serine/threonine-protein kinase [Polyangiales bacterium]
MNEGGDVSLVEGSRLGRYRVLRQIGSGGMATVYEAVHDDLDKRVALKTLHPALALDPEARGRFLREGRAAAKIRHPNVVEVFDVGQEGDTLYLVMEHLAGEDLGTLLGREGVLASERFVDLTLPVIAAVMTAHEAGVVHRDLKPENIFLAQSRNGAVVPKVLDFGISKMAGPGPRLTGSAAMLGTPVYMSPEQAQSGQVDPRSDQYALGVMLYECATGALPFQAPELYPLLHAIVQGAHKPPRALRPDLDPELDAVIERAMHRDPARRFESMRDFGRALLPFASRTGRGVWREVFGAEPTPYGLAAPPLAPVAPRLAHGTLLPRVRQVCVVTAAALRRPRWASVAVVGALAAALVVVAAVMPSGARPVNATEIRAAGRGVAVVAPAPAAPAARARGGARARGPGGA